MGSSALSAAIGPIEVEFPGYSAQVYSLGQYKVALVTHAGDLQRQPDRASGVVASCQSGPWDSRS